MATTRFDPIDTKLLDGQVGQLANPALVPGIQLVQTGAEVIHLVGDIGNPVSLVGASGDCGRWLKQVDGRMSRDAQLWQAEALGVSRELAESVLAQLQTQGLIVDAVSTTAGGRLFGHAHVFGPGRGGEASRIGSRSPKSRGATEPAEQSRLAISSGGASRRCWP